MTKRPMGLPPWAVFVSPADRQGFSRGTDRYVRPKVGEKCGLIKEEEKFEGNFTDRRAALEKQVSHLNGACFSFHHIRLELGFQAGASADAYFLEQVLGRRLEIGVSLRGEHERVVHSHHSFG